MPTPAGTKKRIILSKKKDTVFFTSLLSISPDLSDIKKQHSQYASGQEIMGNMT